jgi:hypothetical protein
MNPFFYNKEAGAKGLPPLSPAPPIPAEPPPLRFGQYRLTIPNTYSTITMSALLRSDCCSPSLRNVVRLPTGMGVHLHRNTQHIIASPPSPHAPSAFGRHSQRPKHTAAFGFKTQRRPEFKLPSIVVASYGAVKQQFSGS